ncbi:MAG: NfeD family protein, partial [Bacilli bacterium]|nr:NfeD family protein [Bacilli bacterium]
MTTVSWIIIFLVLIVIEAVTVDLVSIWFAIGALVCSFVALLTEDLFLQLMVFVLVSAITLFCTKGFVNKIKSRKVVPTNLDRIIGLIG